MKIPRFLIAAFSFLQDFHYWGSAKFYAQAGKAFAEAMPGIKNTNP